jgi:CRISPR-associated protein Cmr3
MTEWYFAQANDVLMFRSSKPFGAGSSFVAEGEFPPHPQIMQGIVRTHVIEQSGLSFDDYGRDAGDLEAVIGPSGSHDLGDLWLEGPFIARRCTTGAPEPLFPVPTDVVYEMQALARGEIKRTYHTLIPDQDVSFVSDGPFQNWVPLRAMTDVQVKAAMGWVTLGQLKAYLQGDSVTEVIEDRHIFEDEERVGLALDRQRRRHKEHMLYTARFTRPQQNVGLLFGTNEGVFRDKEGPIAMGGEARMGFYQRVDEPDLPSMETLQGRVKIVLITPAWFSAGWAPESGLDGFLGPESRLVSMAIDRPRVISGWDLASNRPKPLYRYVPAGSVYYFESVSELPERFSEDAPHTRSRQMGFGQYVAGTW